MGLDIGGAKIIKNAGNGITLNSLVFDSVGRGAANPIPGYNGYKSGGSTYYSAPAGWEINAANWQSSLNTGNGIFTCPVAGFYAMGYNGIHKGGSNIPTGYNTYGYFAFCKNGVATYWVHCNQATVAGNTVWNTGGTSVLFSCAAGDTLALLINRVPGASSPDSIPQNFGLYPDGHHGVWCRLVG